MINGSTGYYYEYIANEYLAISDNKKELGVLTGNAFSWKLRAHRSVTNSQLLTQQNDTWQFADLHTSEAMLPIGTFLYRIKTFI